MLSQSNVFSEECTQIYFSGHALEEPALVLRAVSAAKRSPMAHSPEMGPPLSGEQNDVASQTQAVGSAPLASRRELADLPERIQNTITQARAPSTRRLYALNCMFSPPGAQPAAQNQFPCHISLILSFLQELLDKGHSRSMLKVYLAAISASHAPIVGQSVGRSNLVVCFLKGSIRLKPPLPFTIPTWDLPTVLRALKSPPCEPLQNVDLRSLSLKTALLLALASVKQMGYLQELSLSPT